ncbi:unnamed protein product, partial [Urochloa humidicola]
LPLRPVAASLLPPQLLAGGGPVPPLHPASFGDGGRGGRRPPSSREAVAGAGPAASWRNWTGRRPRARRRRGRRGAPALLRRGAPGSSWARARTAAAASSLPLLLCSLPSPSLSARAGVVVGAACGPRVCGGCLFSPPQLAERGPSSSSPDCMACPAAGVFPPSTTVKGRRGLYRAFWRHRCGQPESLKLRAWWRWAGFSLWVQWRMWCCGGGRRWPAGCWPW